MANDTMKNVSQAGKKNAAVTNPSKGQNQPNYPVSVYLPEHEKNYIENLAHQLGVSRHALMQFAVKHFIAQHRVGKIKVPITRKTITEIKSP